VVDAISTRADDRSCVGYGDFQTHEQGPSGCGAHVAPESSGAGIPTQFPLGSRYAPQTLRTDGPVEEGDWLVPDIAPRASATTTARATTADATARNHRLGTARS
jgi:hypothetical protein